MEVMKRNTITRLDREIVCLNQTTTPPTICPYQPCKNSTTEIWEVIGDKDQFSLLWLKRYENQYQEAVRQREYIRTNFPQAPVWYHYQPLWRCPSEERIGFPIGKFPGDGCKWVCADIVDNTENCIIYSIGVDGEISFDKEARKKWPKCQIHAFDKDDSNQINLEKVNVTFHKEFVLDLNETTHKYNHNGKWIDILKVDIEGGEWNLIPSGLSQGIKFKQLQVEVHDPTAELPKWMQTLEKHNYRMFHQDTNYYCPSCMEYSFVYYDPNADSYPWTK